MSNKQLTPEWKQKISNEADDYIKDLTIKSASDAGYILGARSGYSSGAKIYSLQLISALVRIEELENKLYQIRESYSDSQNSIAFVIANEALSQNNKIDKG